MHHLAPSRRPSSLALLALVALAVTAVSPVMAAPVGYTLDVTTFYQFGVPSDLTFADFGTANPDTGYWRVTNNGLSTFSGTIGQTAVSGFGPDFSYSHAVTLAPGASVVFAVNDESSNYGGYNGPVNTLQPGVSIFLNGTVTLGPDSAGVNLSVNDADIHSGVPRVNPFGVTVDSYVLQGGEPLGRDTGDDFEVTQAPGQYRFFGEGPTAVPEPTSLVLTGMAVAGLAGYSVRRRKGNKPA